MIKCSYWKKGCPAVFARKHEHSHEVKHVVKHLSLVNKRLDDQTEAHKKTTNLNKKQSDDIKKLVDQNKKQSEENKKLLTQIQKLSDQTRN